MNRIHRHDNWDYAVDLIFILATIGAGFLAVVVLMGYAHIAHLLQGE